MPKHLDEVARSILPAIIAQSRYIEDVSDEHATKVARTAYLYASKMLEVSNSSFANQLRCDIINKQASGKLND